MSSSSGSKQGKKKQAKSKRETGSTAGVRVAVLGAGKMGGILLQAFLRSGLFKPEDLVATVAHEARARQLAKQLGISVTTHNKKAAADADVILLGVKPQQMGDVVRGIAKSLKPGALLISFAASVKTGAIEKAAGGKVSVVRAMPNTPAKLGEGITALCRGSFASAEQMALAQKIFATVGRTEIVDEKHMDAVTGL